jgi:hypothetical protein
MTAAPSTKEHRMRATNVQLCLAIKGMNLLRMHS